MAIAEKRTLMRAGLMSIAPTVAAAYRSAALC
jgi:hypothetical protein